MSDNKNNNKHNNDTSFLKSFIFNVAIGISVSVSLAAISSLLEYLHKSSAKRKLKKNNTIAIIHKCEQSESIFALDKVEEGIDVKTLLKFQREYKLLNKNEDIYIVLQTNGGDMMWTEAICNSILSHKGKGKIRCYIPNYALSGGLMIALCCDEIIMIDSAIVSPCDGQFVAKANMSFPTSSIVDAISFKKEKSEPVKEEWLSAFFDAKNCMSRQKDFVEKLCTAKGYDGSTHQIIYEEFFSGKHNHDRAFTASDIVKFGSKLPITVVDKLPDYVSELLN
jgi:membrane-bound ClpP family serine protease